LKVVVIFAPYIALACGRGEEVPEKKHSLTSMDLVLTSVRHADKVMKKI